jgi:large subunit ribosomal protein L32
VRRSRSVAMKMTAPKFAACPKCGEPKMPHRLCPSCGYYNEKITVAPAGE